MIMCGILVTASAACMILSSSYYYTVLSGKRILSSVQIAANNCSVCLMVWFIQNSVDGELRCDAMFLFGSQ